MNPVLRTIIFAALLVAPSLAIDETESAGDNDCIGLKTCGSCFTAAQHCAWCTADGFDAPPKNYERCDHINNLKTYGCPDKYIVFPDHIDTILKVGKFLLTLYLEHWPTVTSPVGFLHW
jgi:hypothetical protein